MRRGDRARLPSTPASARSSRAPGARAARPPRVGGERARDPRRGGGADRAPARRRALAPGTARGDRPPRAPAPRSGPRPGSPPATRRRRVLGQYDVALFGRARPARLLFVGENLDGGAGAARRRSASSSCAGSRCTRHARGPVRAGRLAGRRTCAALAAELIDGAAEGLDAAALAATRPAAAARPARAGPGAAARRARARCSPIRRAAAAARPAAGDDVGGRGARRARDGRVRRRSRPGARRAAPAARRAPSSPRRARRADRAAARDGPEAAPVRARARRSATGSVARRAPTRCGWSGARPPTCPSLDELEAPRAWLDGSPRSPPERALHRLFTRPL